MTQWKITDVQNQTKKLLNIELRHVKIAVMARQLEFHYLLILNSIKFRKFILRVSYIFTSISKVCDIFEIAKFGTREI